jgi:hypothetical protein
MNTKYTTGQAILIPAIIRSASERNGVIFYDVDADTWDGIPEDAIIVDDKAAALKAFNEAMRGLSREIYPR